MPNTGLFHDSLKISKIIPLFKKDNEKLFSNYRPILYPYCVQYRKNLKTLFLSKCQNILRIMI